jgi:hypothetical protein
VRVYEIVRATAATGSNEANVWVDAFGEVAKVLGERGAGSQSYNHERLGSG